MPPPLSQEIVVDSDESGSESSSSSIAQAQQKPKKQSDKKNEKPKESASTTKARNQSASSSSSESESEEDTVPQKKIPQDTTPREEKPTKQPTLPSIPAKPFAPPEGFQPIQKGFSESADTSERLSNLNGKQLWHITAPAGVPFGSIRELALDAVATGQSVLSHKGTEYRLREDQLGAEKTKSLLIPDKHGKVYRRNRLPVVQTFHVEQMVEIPNNASLSGVETRSTIEKLTKPPPPKPRHLRMRYKPFGATDDRPETIGSSSEESGMEEAFQYPRGSDVDRDARKRKHTDVDGSKAQRDRAVESTAKGDLPRKKVKKEHTHSTNDTAKADEENASDDDVNVRGRERKSHSKSTEKKRSKKHREETSQERKARKEDKKRKKREKENVIAV